VDASVSSKTDRLGRRTGPRRKYSVEEKLRILAETRVAGASVSDIARGYGINANVVFGWRRLERRGLLRGASTETASMLPVKVESPTLLPSVKARVEPRRAEAGARTHGVVEVEFPGEIRVRVHGAVDSAVLKRVFDALARR